MFENDSTWMVDRLEIPRVVDCFFRFDYTIELFWLFQNTGFVLSRKRENQIVVTIVTPHSCLLRTFQTKESKLKRKKFYEKTF